MESLGEVIWFIKKLLQNSFIWIAFSQDHTGHFTNYTVNENNTVVPLLKATL